MAVLACNPRSKTYTERRPLSGLTLWASPFMVAFCGTIFAQETPLLTNYPPSVYKAHNQNWSIDQSADRLMYLANSDGLVEYDGANWRLYPLPNRQIVRSVLCDEYFYSNKNKDTKAKTGHRIYVGGFNEFGYWQKLANGELAYHSLSKGAGLASLKTEEIWHILKTPRYIYFQSFSSIYRYDGKDITEIKGEGNFMFLRYVHGKLLIQMIGKGLFELKDKKFVPVAGTEGLSSSVVSAILPFPGHRTLVATTKNGLFILENGTITPWKIAVSDELRRNLINKAILLPSDSSYVFGTIQKGLYVVSAQGTLKYRFNKDNGLQNNTVLALHVDRNRNLWVGLDQGAGMMWMSSPLLADQNVNSPLGTTYAAALWRGKLYVGSNNGVFVKKWRSDEPFIPVAGLGGQTWNLTVINDQLLCGHNDATYAIKENGLSRISNVTGGWVFLPVATPDDTLLLQGAYNGLHVYKRNTEGTWAYHHPVKGTPPLPVKQIVRDSAGSFWLAHAYKGLYRTRLSASLDTATTWREYKEPKDIPDEFSIELTELAGKVVVKSDGRFLVTDQNGNLSTDGTFKGEAEQPFKLRSGMDGDWFKVFATRVEYYGKDKTQRLDLSLIRNNENVIPLSDTHYFFCLDNGYALYDRSAPVAASPMVPHVMIRRVANLRLLSELFATDSAATLPAAVRAVRLTYTTPVYGQNVQYQYRLSGLSDQWSEWTSRTFVEFTNLTSDTYTFEVKNNLSDQITTYQFTVRPYWYETNLARLGFGILALAMIVMAILYQEKRIERHHLKVIREQEERLRQERLMNERKIMAIQNEKLQGELQAKSQQISNVAINVVRKNEILEEIRDELMQVKEELGQQLPNIHYQKLLNSIERNVAGKDDWTLFEENFNEVHEEFFKRLKKTCPSVSPSELRLAACLRMNLSTKEMAPALGISTRGVEIKRYRLRKKLGLGADANLAEYMMAV